MGCRCSGKLASKQATAPIMHVDVDSVSTYLMDEAQEL